MNEDRNIAKGVGRRSYLGRTLPSLLYHAAAEYPNEAAFVQKTENGWKPYSSEEFKTAAEEAALGLRAVGLAPGDRVALYMESDVYFCLVDMACLIAGLVDVPIYLTHVPETISFVLDHADAHAVVVSSRARLKEILPEVNESSTVVRVIVLDDDPVQGRDGLAEHITLHSLREIRSIGRNMDEEDPTAVRELSDHLAPDDLATIIYTSGTTGRPKGVMLTHENISSNALTCFDALTGYVPGANGEILLSFLPLTHVFARTNYYLALSQGSQLYFTTPDELVADMADVRPTMLITVPRVLEKVYARILEKSEAAKGLKGKIARWGMGLAQDGEDADGGVLSRLKSGTADRLVFKKWRGAFGGRLKFLISGGAALSKEISDVFEAGGLPILQGYGLTETSPVIAFNRPGKNRSGTVGTAIKGVEIRIAEDGEILTRGPHVMAGYFREEEKTREVVSDDGWFHTGDIGVLSDDGYLTITDRKKNLFKLSTGKYVMPQPLENLLAASPLISQAVIIGDGHKFAAALLFAEPSALHGLYAQLGVAPIDPAGGTISDPKVIATFQKIVDQANREVPPWSTIKRFRIIADQVSVENGLLTPTLKIIRSAVQERFGDVIRSIYADEHKESVEQHAGADHH